MVQTTNRKNTIPFLIKAKKLINKDVDNIFKYLDSFKVCDKEEIIEILNNLSEEDKEISSSHIVEL